MTARQRHRRNRSAGLGHAPARPRERNYPKLVPVRDDVFQWAPGELVVGRNPTLDEVLARCWEVAGPSGKRK
jgi:hypothetical protein